MLTPIIKDQIARDGFITVADYMDLCLLHPEHGYYTTQTVFGGQGDFVTAPEVSQLFGEMIGVWAMLQWERLEKPAAFNLIELGPGRGLLMRDLLRVASKNSDFIQGLQLHFVEASPKLRAIQKQAVADYTVSPFWHDTIETIDVSRPSIIVANEFFDALSIQQFVIHQKKWHERVIVLKDNDLAWSFNPQPATERSLPDVHYLAEGTLCEYNALAADIMRSLCQQIKKSGGALVAIDYGDHTVHRFGDTLQAVKDHIYCDVLDHPGQADLTAHVDFYQLDEIASNMRLETEFTTQDHFLKQHGITERVNGLLAGQSTPQQKNAMVSGYQRLIDPDQMGHLFKVLAVQSS